MRKSSEPRHSKEEFERLGEAIYARDIHPRLLAADEGKFIAIDIESGAFELDTDDFAATERLLTRLPEAQIWLMRVGHPTAYRIMGGMNAGLRLERMSA